MTRFHCIGSRCEASGGTSGWTIADDAGHYQRLEGAMGGDPLDRVRLHRAIRREPEERRTSDRHGLIVLDDGGACMLLDPEGTCSIHRRFGAETLPHVCAIYPRQISLARHHLEVAGALSCPEVARQLFAGGDATAVELLDPTTVRNRVTQIVASDAPDPYDQCLDDVRAVVVDLLETPGYPLASRLFFVGWFAEQTRAGFHRGAPRPAEALADALGFDEEHLAAWHAGFTSVEVTSPLAASVLSGVLKDRIESDIHYEPFRELVRGCLANLGGRSQGDAVTLDPQQTFDAYVVWRGRRDGSAIDRMLTSYAIDFWLKEYYTRSRDLAIHAGKLVLRIALLRFLLFSHPHFDEEDPTRTLVEVTFKLARAVEHDAEFADNLDSLLARLQITSLAHLMFLMKV
jgi:lysine-N-methylase